MQKDNVFIEILPHMNSGEKVLDDGRVLKWQIVGFSQKENAEPKSKVKKTKQELLKLLAREGDKKLSGTILKYEDPLKPVENWKYWEV